MRVGETIRIAAGYLTKALPLHKWLRPDGLTSFMADMISLRKTLLLCKSCEHKMPRRWGERYGYDFVQGYYAECAHCTRCRRAEPTNMYVAREGRYAVQLAEERRILAQMQERERRAYDNDKKYLVNLP